MENKKYTLSDIDTLRAKSGLSYEEVVGLLEKYDGDMARALIELEKRGVVTDKDIHIRVNGDALKTLRSWWDALRAMRVIVEKGEKTLCDLPLLYMLLALLLGWRLVLVSAVLALVFGCHVRMTGMPKSAEKSAETTVQSAPEAPAQAEETNAEAADPVRQEDDGFKSVTVE